MWSKQTINVCSGLCRPFLTTSQYRKRRHYIKSIRLVYATNDFVEKVDSTSWSSWRTAADPAVVVVTVVVVALAEVTAVSQLRVRLADRVADASATLAAPVTAADRAPVVSVTHNPALPSHGFQARIYGAQGPPVVLKWRAQGCLAPTSVFSPPHLNPFTSQPVDRRNNIISAPSRPPLQPQSVLAPISGSPF